MELIKITENEEGKRLVSARELHEFLEIETRFSIWFNRMKEYGFSENNDFVAIEQKRTTAQGNETTSIDYAISIDMSKEISMIQRTEKGKQARQYFIDCEKTVQALNTSQLSPELQMFSQMFKAIANNELEQKKIKEDIETTKGELQGIREAVLLNPSSWRKDTSSIISKVALKLGGFEHIKDVREGVYKALNETYGVNIKQRLTNKQKNMALEGCSKSRINKVNYLDVIEGDKKLLNGYLSIISKLAIKHGIGGNTNEKA